METGRIDTSTESVYRKVILDTDSNLGYFDDASFFASCEDNLPVSIVVVFLLNLCQKVIVVLDEISISRSVVFNGIGRWFGFIKNVSFVWMGSIDQLLSKEFFSFARFVVFQGKFGEIA